MIKSAQFEGAGLSPAPSPVCCSFSYIAQGSRGLILLGRGSRICRQRHCCYCAWFSQDLWVLHISICKTLDDRRRDKGTNFILRNKEQETRLNLQVHDEDIRPIRFKHFGSLKYITPHFRNSHLTGIVIDRHTSV